MKVRFALALILLASTFRDVVAAENVEVKILSVKDFSKYAANLCKKLKLSGPTEITSLAHRQSLLTTLNRLQLEKALQLDNIEIKDDAKAKAKIQSELDAIVKELQKFPNLQYKKVDGYVEPRSTYSALAPTNADKSNLPSLGSNYRSLPFSEVRYPLLAAGAKYQRLAPFGGKYRPRILSGEDYQIKFNVLRTSPEVLMHDSISVVREQIRMKHGENYIK